MNGPCDHKQKLLESREVVFEDGRQRKLNYFLLIDEVNLIDGTVFCENYGIKATITDSDGAITEDSELVPGITPSYSKIMELLKTLIANLVTPVSLKYVVEDFLSI